MTVRIEDIKAADGWALWQAAFGPPVKIEGHNALYLCPWESGREPHSFKVLTRAHEGHAPGFWHDFARDESGDILDAVQRTRHCTLQEACEIVGRAAGLNGHANGPAGKSAPPVPKATPLAPTQEELAASYGLVWADFEAAGCKWEGRRVAYPILKADGSLVWKYKTTTRNDAGKRESSGDPGSGFQHGIFGCGLHDCEGATLVFTEGEEKALVARAAGFPAISGASGAANVPDAAISLIAAAKPARIVLAFDADPAGEKGAETAASKLKAAGLQSSRVKWPDGVLSGYDLTDHATAGGGLEAVRELIEAATRPACKWKPIPVSDLFVRQPPTEYLVQDIIPRGTLGLVTGAAGVHKSNLLFDMAVCVSAGKTWLDRQPDTSGKSFKTIQVPVAWYNADNPTKGLKKRFRAFLVGHGLTCADPLTLLPVSFPEPLLHLTDPGAVDELRAFVLVHHVGLLVVDNLQLVKGAADENDASEMGPVISELRRLIESTGITIILIHHENKQGGYRGSSSIRDLIDWSICVKREGHKDQISVKADKCRDAEIPAFGAAFWFRHWPGTKDLQECRMHPWSPPEADDSIDSWTRQFISDCPGKSLNEIEKAAQEDGLPRDKVRDLIKELESSGDIARRPRQGRGGGYAYYPLP